MISNAYRLVPSLLAILLVGFIYEWNRDKEFDAYSDWQISKYRLGQTIKPINATFGNEFLIELNEQRLSVSNKVTGKELFASKGNSRGFISCGTGKEEVYDWSSFFLVSDEIKFKCLSAEIASLDFTKDQKAVTISGVFLDCKGVSFNLEFEEDPEEPEMLIMTGRCSEGDHGTNRLMIQGEMDPEELPFGFGIQFSKMHMKGQILSTFVREHGVTRGLQPWSFLINLSFLYSGMAGQFHWSYCPSPVFSTSKVFRSFAVLSYEYSVFDFREEDSFRIAIWNPELVLSIGRSKNMKEALTLLTTKTGRMPAMPEWVDNGVILGVQGGTNIVEEIVWNVVEREVPISALWIQDWSGKVLTGEAMRVLWNWKRNSEIYPDWHQLQEDLKSLDIKFLNYVNPYCVEVQKKQGEDGIIDEMSLCERAEEEGYLLLDSNKSHLSQKSISINFKTIDLLQSKARDWYKNWIIDHVIREPNSKGFMADFGENLPIDAEVPKYNSGEHNKFPVLWAEVVRGAINTIESQEGAEKILSFARSGYRESPKYAKNFWVGDQLQTWDEYSGMKSALTGMLTGGVSGFTLIHGDIGGYVTLPVPGVGRTQEMMIRWIQLMAFSSCMRTHEGTLPKKVVQAYSDEQVLAILKKYGRVFVALKEKRREILREATESGIPLMRPMYLEFPEAQGVYAIEDQFMYGDSVLVAPVLWGNVDSIQVYFPKIDERRRKEAGGFWVSLVSGEEIEGCDCFHEIAVALEDIPVFVPRRQVGDFDFLKKLIG